MNRALASLCVVAGIAFIAFGVGNLVRADQSPVGAAVPATQPAAIDLNNTICPVSDEKVGDSKLTETYDGKIYHFCCDDCPKQFLKDPEKYAKLVAADPAKYGVKP
jgi:YHS domain-containing protein